MTRLIETKADLIRLAKSSQGIDADQLKRAGLPVIGAVEAELRRTGYEVAIDGEGDQRKLRITAEPGVGAKRRKANWQPLFGDGPRESAGMHDVWES